MVRVLLALIAAMPISVSLAETPLEDALMQNDECEGSGDNATCTLNALQVRVSQKQSDESACTPVNQYCGQNWAEKQCCDSSNECVRDGSIFKCKAGQSGGGWGCKAENNECGGWGQSCCGGLKCKESWGRKTCQRESGGSCKNEREACGGWGQSCCGGLECKDSWGTKSCQRSSGGSGGSCRQESESCGGWGQSCCSGMKCEESWGKKSCKKESDPSGWCKKDNEDCGGWFQSCCDGSSCKDVWGKKKCQKDQGGWR